MFGIWQVIAGDFYMILYADCFEVARQHFSYHIRD